MRFHPDPSLCVLECRISHPVRFAVLTVRAPESKKMYVHFRILNCLRRLRRLQQGRGGKTGKDCLVQGKTRQDKTRQDKK